MMKLGFRVASGSLEMIKFGFRVASGSGLIGSGSRVIGYPGMLYCLLFDRDWNKVQERPVVSYKI